MKIAEMFNRSLQSLNDTIGPEDVIFSIINHWEIFYGLHTTLNTHNCMEAKYALLSVKCRTSSKYNFLGVKERILES